MDVGSFLTHTCDDVAAAVCLFSVVGCIESLLCVQYGHFHSGQLLLALSLSPSLLSLSISLSLSLSLSLSGFSLSTLCSLFVLCHCQRWMVFWLGSKLSIVVVSDCILGKIFSLSFVGLLPLLLSVQFVNKPAAKNIKHFP